MSHLCTHVLVQFEDGSLSVQKVDDIDKFDCLNPPPIDSECQIWWKVNGKKTKKAEKFAATVLRYGEEAMLRDAMKQVVDGGKELSELEVAEHASAGRGLREKKKRTLSSSDDEASNESTLPASEPKKTAEKRSHSVNVILQRIKRNREESQSRHTEFQKEVELDREILSKLDELIATTSSRLDQLVSSTSQMLHLLKPTDLAKLRESTMRSPPTLPGHANCSTPSASKGNSSPRTPGQALCPKPSTPMTSPTPLRTHTPGSFPRPSLFLSALQKPGQTNNRCSSSSTSPISTDNGAASNELSEEDIDFLSKLEATVIRANKTSASKLTNDLMHGMFSVEYMSTHCLAGGNPTKVTMSSAIVQNIIGKVQSFFPTENDVTIRGYMRQKLSNAVKKTKSDRSSAAEK